ncbi:thiamine pyrophosphate-binding protein [Methanothermococcus okinawensis]|uniref:Acetolactate synthase n=1 Tax=Methanothermococcus okinawensis (strain DSM 14208 / JCM 11175 / IH1) TaxID=647113 RepID=F8AKV3_METOI|nr:thiamine pyrophosphate-binding protein [Methanothermococcus okinawensis]AEH07575.1 Acetolactate synthase [Methanothermococcus okinawensis IH1]
MEFTDTIINFLMKNNIKTVFSYPGEQIFPLYNKLNESPIKNIMVRHEQGALHMADGYSRITNHIGVCLATAGPGATNLMTGIATAYKDSSSVIAITGRCMRKYINKNYFQEIPLDFLNIYKGYFMNKPDIGYFINAFSETLNNKKPIHLNIPSDILKSKVKCLTEYDNNNDGIYNNTYNKYNRYNNSKNNKNNDKNNNYHKNEDKLGYKDIKGKIIKKHINIKDIKKPLLLIGQGIYGTLSYNDMSNINNILKECNIPIATTYPARGVIDENYKNCLGLVGRRGTFIANRYIVESDVIFSIGVSLSYNTIPESIRDKVLKKVINLDIKINDLSDIKNLIDGLNELYNDSSLNNSNKVMTTNTNNINNYYNNCDNNNTNKDNKGNIPNINNSLNFKLGDYSSKIKEILYNLPNDSIITTDAGNHTVFVSLLKKCVIPRNIISSHSMGTMGFGLPASIGVKFGCLDYNIDREVISINGDGGFQMNMQELATVSENNLKILIIIMKNSRLNVFGNIKNPDFNKIADAYDIDNVYIEDIDEIGGNIKYYLNNNKPYLMVVECENEGLPKPFI